MIGVGDLGKPRTQWPNRYPSWEFAVKPLVLYITEVFGCTTGFRRLRGRIAVRIETTGATGKKPRSR
jgi:hypothetical protein